MRDLNCGGEEHRVDFPGRKFPDGRLKGGDVFRQDPLINGYPRHHGAAAGETAD